MWIVEIGAHRRDALDVVGRVLRRVDVCVLRKVHELGLGPAERIDHPFVESALGPRQIVLDFGDERRTGEAILGRERARIDRLDAASVALQPLLLPGDPPRRDVVEAVVIALVPQARGPGGIGLEVSLPERVARASRAWDPARPRRRSAGRP